MSVPKRSLLFLSVLLAAVLAACSQSKTPQSVSVVVEVVSIDSANVKSVQLSITGPDFDQTFTQSVTSGATLRFNPVTVKYGDYTFAARGFSDAAAGGVVLYKTSKTVSVTNSSANLALLMTRTTSNITVTASGVAADEAVVATSGGISQALTNNGDGTAAGTLLGVATGDQVFVVAEARDAGGAVVKQGQSATIALSEADKTVGVALNAVGGNALPDSVTLSVTPDEPIAGKPVTLNIVATDPDGNNDLAVALINWMDGSDVQSQPLTDGTASLTHSYLVAGSYTVTVTVYDRPGASKSASQTITVKQDPDAGADPATLSTVTINAIAVAADANAVIAKIYKGTPSTPASDLQATYTVSLSKVGSGEWKASLELHRHRARQRSKLRLHAGSFRPFRQRLGGLCAAERNAAAKRRGRRQDQLSKRRSAAAHRLLQRLRPAVRAAHRHRPGRWPVLLRLGQGKRLHHASRPDAERSRPEPRRH